MQRTRVFISALLALLASGALAQPSQLILTAAGHATELYGAGGVEAPQDGHMINVTAGPQLTSFNLVHGDGSVSTGGNFHATAGGLIGLLQVYAFAYETYGTDGAGHTVASGYSTSSGNAFFSDSIVASAPGAANGTPITYTASFKVSGTHSVPDSGDFGGYECYLSAHMSLSDNVNSSDTPNWYSPAHTEQSTTLIVSLNTLIGRTIRVSAQMQNEAYVSSNAQTARSAVSDYTGAGSVTLSASLPGANLIGASGHNFGPSCPGDLNGDDQVDDADFVIFAAAYNTLDCADPAMPAGCPADLNGDGVVDDADFVLFVAAYNELVCP